MEPGALDKVPHDIMAVVRGNKIVLVGPMVTYREIDMTDGQEKWIDNLNIGNAIYYLHIGLSGDGGAVTIRIHEMVIKDEGTKYLADKPARDIPLKDGEEYDKEQLKNITAGPVIEPDPEEDDTPEVAPLNTEEAPTEEKKKPLQAPSKEEPRMYDVPEPEGEDLENIKTLAKNTNLTLAKALVASTEIGDKDLLTWKQVCNYLAKGEVDNKFYIALKNSKFRGKVLDNEVLVEVANFLDTL
jgi:hypothetical protein